MFDTILNYVLIGLLFLIPISLLAAATYVLIRPLEEVDQQRSDGTTDTAASKRNRVEEKQKAGVG